MRPLNKFEKKFRKYAIPNLTTIMIVCYIIGYCLYYMYPGLVGMMTLNPYAILHGQFFRLFTWVLVPPTHESLLGTVITLYFYWSIGTTMEKVWGDFRYNVYIFSGLLFTLIGSFVAYGLANTFFYDAWNLSNSVFAEAMFELGSSFFSTYYVTMSIFLAFAATFPNVRVLLMFIIPIKVKWLGIFYGAIMAYQLIAPVQVRIGTTILDFSIFSRVALISSILNFLIFFITTRGKGVSPAQVKRQQEFKREVRKTTRVVTRHKCAICGRTDESHPDLEFRFCSKCNGNYEYCQDHLFTHEHVK